MTEISDDGPSRDDVSQITGNRAVEDVAIAFVLRPART
jgi:hypothetical protein